MLSIICILYTPKFRTPDSGCFVATNPKVMNCPASFGHDFRIGKSPKDALFDVISVTGPLVSSLGNDAVIFVSSGNFFNLFNRPVGTSIFVISVIR